MVQVVFALILLVYGAVAVVSQDDQKFTCPNNSQGHVRTTFNSVYGDVVRVLGDCGIPRDCEDVRDAGNTESGVYTIYINKKNAVRVWCDMMTDGGGWTVFQTRVNGSTDFYREWDEYSLGFGNLNHEFWLGNQYLHHLTSSDWYSLRIYVEDFENETRFANYNIFTVANAEDGYKLFVTGYTGDAGYALYISNGNRFSTKDKDLDAVDGRDCAELFQGAWWYKDCHNANLNGKYLSGPTTTYANGVVWYQFKGHHYSLKSSKMMIRKGWGLLQGVTVNP